MQCFFGRYYFSSFFNAISLLCCFFSFRPQIANTFVASS
jgi:hypothetical protein